MLSLKISGRPTITVDTIAEAQMKFCQLRIESGEGASTWPDGKLVDLDTKKKYRVSYNGRVWDGKTAIA